MTVADLQNLFDYGHWANQKLLDAVAKLTPEQFTETVAGSYGSVRNTLVHTLSAEWGWLDRCGGHARGPALVAADYPTVESVIAQWRQVEVWQREFLATQRDEDLDRKIEFALGGPPEVRRMGDLLQHAVIHGVHHRGQVALLLRMLGVAPGNFDRLYFETR
ncbi:MAG: DinB family protein [Bryobacteraceae bacterium]